MPYGTIKVDTITFTDGGVDKSVAISGLVQNPTFTGNVTVTGTVSGATVRATTVSGITISGTTVNAASGVFTTQISGAVVVAPAGLVGTPSVQVGTGASVAPGFYGAGTDQLGISTAGSSRLVVDSVGQIRVVTLGSAAAPALVLGNDLNTGLYSLGADQVAISTAGIGRLFVDASGNVGIGSAPSTTAGRLLDINGGLLQPEFQLRATSATAAYTTYTLDTVNSLVTFVSSDWPVRYFINGNERLRITSDGKVGIGTSSPSEPLHIAATGANSANIRLQSGDGRTYNVGSTGSGYGSSGKFIIYDITAAAERFCINSSGSVGIGTTSPASLLTSYAGNVSTLGAKTSTGLLIENNGNVGNISQIGLGYTFSSTYHPVAIAAVTNSGSSSTRADLVFAVRDVTTDTAPAERLRITSDGKVGIGTSSPGNALHVNGSIQTNSTSHVIYSNNFGNYSSASDLSLIAGSASLLFKTGAANDERARIDSSGRLLVGTSTAQTGNNTIYARVQVVGSSVGAAAGGIVSIGRSEAATSITTDETLGTLVFGDSGAGEYAWITCEADAAAGTNDYPGRLVFSTTADGAPSPTERMRIRNDGTIFFQKTSASLNNEGFQFEPLAGVGITKESNPPLALNRQTNDGSIIVFYRGTTSVLGSVVGSISVTTSATAYNTSSDYRLKENVVPLLDGIDRLKQLKPSQFNFIINPDKTVDGFIAHEVQTIVPEAITGEKDGKDEDGAPIYQGIDQSKLVPLLTAALQEAVERIETLEAKVAALKAQ